MIFYYNMLMSVCFGVIVVLYGGVSKNFQSVLHSFLNALLNDILLDIISWYFFFMVKVDPVAN